MFYFLGIPQKGIEIVFLFDNSNEMPSEEYKKIKNYIKAAMSSYKISPNYGRVRIVTYGGPNPNLIDGTSQASIEHQLDLSKRVNQKPDFNAALSFVQSYVFNEKSGSDPKTEKVLIVFAREGFTVSNPEQTKKTSERMGSDGIKVIVVGVGKLDSTLTDIATNHPDKILPTSKKQRLEESLGDLEKLVALLTGMRIFLLLIL